MIILCRINIDDYLGFVLSADEDIEDFLATFNISSDQTNRLIEKKDTCKPEACIEDLFCEFIKQYTDFPTTSEMTRCARECILSAFNLSKGVINKEPDKWLLKWIDVEYRLFKAFEQKCYGDRLKVPFGSMDELITFSNTVLNRRKSRAGKSLEYHLSEILYVQICLLSLR